MTDKLPFILLGDSPRMPTGLGRIARDLGVHLAAAQDRLGIDLFQVGWEDQGDASTAFSPAWPWAPFWQLGGDWGATSVRKIAKDRFGDQPVILFAVWDPGRVAAYVLGESWHGDVWGYLAVDGVNPKGTLGGLVPTAVRAMDRVLGYGRWGAEVLRGVRGDGPEAAVPYLPHGLTIIEDVDYRPAWFDRLHPSRPILGVVATNQPRKDWHAAVKALADLPPEWQGWFHVDQPITMAWSLPELINLYNVGDRVVVTTPNTPGMSDHGLYASYASCTVTLCPGKGEGFGYPLVESLMMGTPAVGLDYAGGAELVPRMDWRALALRAFPQGAYLIDRPHFNEPNLVACLREAAAFKAKPYGAAYCRGAVAHLDWNHLWPRWESWIRKGLERVRAEGYGARRRAILDAARAFTVQKV